MHFRRLIAASAMVLSACSAGNSVRTPSAASKQPDPPLFAGEVWGPDQDAIAQRILDASVETAKKNSAGGPMHRDAHPKHHGCVKAHWKTAKLGSQLGNDSGDIGLFGDDGSEFDAWVRFSNGSPDGEHADDSTADVRGMAIKLLNVKGSPRGNQDFLLMTSPRFFSQDAADYMQLHEALGGSLSLVEYLALHPRNALIINSARVKIASPLDPTYFSPVPSRFGNQSMRFKAVPCPNLPKLAVKKGPTALREALVDTLGKQSACFDFYVEPNRDPAHNPVEDPRLAWGEKTSPFLLAGRLTIPQQTGIDSTEQLNFCENASFDPWNSQDQVRPLGQINRIRKVVYEGVSGFRHEENRLPRLEPTNLEPCKTDATAALCRNP